MEVHGGKLNAGSPWTRFTCDTRALYARRDTREESLEEPAEGVKAQVALPAAQFEPSYGPLLRRRERIEAGEIKPASPWTRVVNQGRAFYQKPDASELVLQLEEPAEGVQGEGEAASDEQFEQVHAQLLKRREMAEAGLLQPASPWMRFTNGGRAWYQRREPFAQTLEEPGEGVRDEQALPDEQFGPAYSKLLKRNEEV